MSTNSNPIENEDVTVIKAKYAALVEAAEQNIASTVKSAGGPSAFWMYDALTEAHRKPDSGIKFECTLNPGGKDGASFVIDYPDRQRVVILMRPAESVKLDTIQRDASQIPSGHAKHIEWSPPLAQTWANSVIDIILARGKAAYQLQHAKNAIPDSALDTFDPNRPRFSGHVMANSTTNAAC